MEEYQDHSLGSRVFQKIRDNILNGTYKEKDACTGGSSSA